MQHYISRISGRIITLFTFHKPKREISSKCRSDVFFTKQINSETDQTDFEQSILPRKSLKNTFHVFNFFGHLSQI